MMKRKAPTILLLPFLPPFHISFILCICSKFFCTSLESCVLFSLLFCSSFCSCLDTLPALRPFRPSDRTADGTRRHPTAEADREGHFAPEMGKAKQATLGKKEREREREIESGPRSSSAKARRANRPSNAATIRVHQNRTHRISSQVIVVTRTSSPLF